MSPDERRAILSAALERAGLSASQATRILGLADEYAAAMVDAWARTPRSQGGQKGAAA